MGLEKCCLSSYLIRQLFFHYCMLGNHFTILWAKRKKLLSIVGHIILATTANLLSICCLNYLALSLDFLFVV